MPVSALAQDSVFHFNHLSLRGNKRTKEVVFYREIGYRPGDTIHNIQAAKLLFRQRLSGIEIFNFVQVDALADTLLITVKERIYTWGLPRLRWADRNFNVWWEKKDPARLYYGATLYFNNLYGLNHEAQVTLIHGYNRQIAGKYTFPFPHHSKGWSFIPEFRYLQNHELWYKTENDRLQFLKDESTSVQKDLELKLSMRHRINFFDNIEILLSGRYYRISDSAYRANPAYLNNGTAQRSLAPGIFFNSDHRIQRNYPVGGYLLRAGLNMLLVDGREYWPGATFRFSNFTPLGHNLVLAQYFGASHTFARVTALPYNLGRQLGYQNDYVRGYEPYVADGKGFVLGKLALRKALFNNYPFSFGRAMPVNNYKKMPLSLWFSIFADAGHVLNPAPGASNRLNRGWMAGTGIGLDLIVYYNSMMRLDYSINRDLNTYFNLSFTNAF